EEMAAQDTPVFTVADGLIWLSQALERNSAVRRLQVVKMRGRAPMPGLHTFRMSDDGITVFPRAIERIEGRRPWPAPRLSSGVAGLDEMLSGGLQTGNSV